MRLLLPEKLRNQTWEELGTISKQLSSSLHAPEGGTKQAFSPPLYGKEN